MTKERNDTMSSTWAITLRPKDGITDEDVYNFKSKFLKYKHYKGHYAITEMKDGPDSRHIHCCLWLTSVVPKSDLIKKLDRIFHDSWIYRCSRTVWNIACTAGVEPMYNDDWYSKYLKKDNTRVEIGSNGVPPVAERELAYAEYNELRSKKQTKKKRASDLYFNKLEVLWNEWKPEKHKNCDTVYAEVSVFMADMMYRSRKIRILTSLRRIREVTHSLCAYIRKSKTIDFWDGKDPVSGNPDRSWDDANCATCNRGKSWIDLFSMQEKAILGKRKRKNIV